MSLSYLITYAAFITFVVAVAARIYKIESMPVHLRWELYPVAHEGKRAHYGGSYFEELNWWTKPRPFSLIGELKGMIPEMLFIKALWENNRPLWYRSFPFHFGLYCLIGWAGLLVVGAGAQMANLYVGAGAGVVGSVIHYLTIFAGVMGLILSTFGAFSLLQRRLTDPEVDGYTSGAHIFNLCAFLLALIVADLAFVLVDRDFSIARAYIHNILTFGNGPAVSFAVALEMVLFSLLMAYVPLTHMSHFLTKYYFYHKIRWDDEPNFKGSDLEKRITRALGYPVNWSAPHLKADGKKNWADIATEEVDK
jgi:nitrate reductase gamma subunit